ncbi:MAG: flagellar hook capping FlgD N-terminal domain-containing protein [Aminobacterium sp.]|jgi:flagellar basal-body rod modification protein FlgD|uniref:Basal-body rod modification protein FlgD n=1 Tax=bioreactor metagenome TaxID=1076179 RepID=A0A645DSE0_9ZZZZ|nr:MULTISPECIES: flagellar hook capping FlgD N-terminal domain-containing protein [unclassified Aminobacterium]MDD2207070.1 flagellar hook capping FlgD N-terminal domain-containing protein [Aminobacterium sp.]MDD3707431.1 flagellar hook capping FlgD N-terminal domain-containing protein [Aminobacterium sp.]MDD4228773.1 flagellar hook capping FlgD N-terminal domain-containing protein [Aminobacterium sp.]MDD4550608.1 flagellar hook capping FlgD N-terminal domain-containing protein [Aminobacterium 
MFVQSTDYSVTGSATTASATSATEQKSKTDSNGGLDQDAFFKILITQLTHQDPMNPLQDREFIAQMAQFTTVEKLTNMGKVVDEMATVNRGNAVSYLGKNVSFYDENGEVMTSKVQAVWFDDKEGVILQVPEGQIKLAGVLSVS